MLFSINNEFTLTVHVKAIYIKTIIAIFLFFLYYTKNICLYILVEIYFTNILLNKYYFLIVNIQFL